jgi:hypothetical protein
MSGQTTVRGPVVGKHSVERSVDSLHRSYAGHCPVLMYVYVYIYIYCDMLPESQNIGFGQYRRIRHNAPLKALRVNG